MVNQNIIIKQHLTQNYTTIFNQNTGLFIRLEKAGSSEPFWSHHGPELIDISITNWCDKNCLFCYKQSSQFGTHINLEDYRNIISQANKMGVLQVALGGGNPNQHPNFCEILQLTREEYNIVPSFTTNGRGLGEKTLLASRNYCGAVAVSAYEPFTETVEAAQKLLDYGIRTNIHFLLTSETISTAIRWLMNPPKFLLDINAIIFLNYKPVGRNTNPKLLLRNSRDISTFFTLAQTKYPFKIGFDSCSISGIAKFTKTSPIFIDSCEAARFSMYISEELKMYPCSFLVNKIEGVPIIGQNILEKWRNGDAFVKFRDKLSASVCTNCLEVDTCFSGCPVFPEINLCSKD
jgi:Predicted Fe-S oxidoreductases